MLHERPSASPSNSVKVDEYQVRVFQHTVKTKSKDQRKTHKGGRAFHLACGRAAGSSALFSGEAGNICEPGRGWRVSGSMLVFELSLLSSCCTRAGFK